LDCCSRLSRRVCSAFIVALQTISSRISRQGINSSAPIFEGIGRRRNQDWHSSWREESLSSDDTKNSLNGAVARGARDRCTSACNASSGWFTKQCCEQDCYAD
jgi:hypothetical protein